MWFFRKRQKVEIDVRPKLSEYETLEELILRLENTPILSREDEAIKHKSFTEKVIDRMIDEGVTRGGAADDHKMYNQSEEAFRDHLKSTNDDLMEQISVFNFGLDRWFDYGECHPPYFPWRIAIILSKRKELEKEKRFLAAYCRHFKYRVGTRDQQITNRAIKKGAISNDGIPNEEDVLSIAKNLVQSYGLDSRRISYEMRKEAYKSGSETEFLLRDMVENKVRRITESVMLEIDKPN